jgi:hypothetical protein
MSAHHVQVSFRPEVDPLVSSSFWPALADASVVYVLREGSFLVPVSVATLQSGIIAYKQGER